LFQRFVAQDLVLVIFGLNSIANSGVVISAFLALYAITYLLIDYNFLYRLWALMCPERIHLFKTKWFIILLVSFALVFFVNWTLLIYYFFLPTDHGRLKMRDVVMAKYGVDTMDRGMIMGDYFHADGSRNVHLAIGVFILITILGLCSSFIIYAAATITYYLKTAKLISEKSMQLQRQLFVLCTQTIVPLLLLYSPCLVDVGFTCLGIDVELYGDLTALSISLFLPIDGLAVLYSMKDYRKAAISVITC
ncbi:hypothetical protein PENTCL1PPCAC_14920, partial [Pristionchus entomophagus]